ncbi:MAG: DUF2235 domain-containing protein [Planctomycetota bacterium]
MNPHFTFIFLLGLICCIVSAGNDAHGKTIIVLMDGTWNEPEFSETDEYPQGDSTNVEKMKRLLAREGQSVHYFRGVGTDGKKFTRVKDGAFGTSAERRVDEAMQAVKRNYVAGDEIAIFGFSRGAATSRILAKRIRNEGVKGSLPFDSWFCGTPLLRLAFQYQN